MRIPHEEIKRRIIELDENHLNEGLIQSLLKNMPEPETIQSVYALKDEFNDMNEAEQFCVLVSGSSVQNSYISLGTWQNDVNTRIVLPGNSSFCQAQAFEVLTPTPTYRQFVICLFYLSKFHTKHDFVFRYHILQFYLHCKWGFLIMGVFLSGALVDVLLPGTQQIHSSYGYYL